MQRSNLVHTVPGFYPTTNGAPTIREAALQSAWISYCREVAEESDAIARTYAVLGFVVGAGITAIASHLAPALLGL